MKVTVKCLDGTGHSFTNGKEYELQGINDKRDEDGDVYGLIESDEGYKAAFQLRIISQ